MQDNLYQDIEFYCVIVVYNTAVNASKTCQNLKKIENHNINVIVVDNSTYENNNDEICKTQNFAYIKMGYNAGISKAYNKALDFLIGKDGVVIWFDDDTDITQQYFDILKKSVIENKDYDIFTPLIVGQDNKIWSPSEMYLLKNKQIKNKYQKINKNRFTAINSSTAVRLKVYQNYRYDERLFLDLVDHNFFYDQRKLKRKFYILDTKINHNLSTIDKTETIDSTKFRFNIMISDFLVFCSKQKSLMILGYIKVLIWGIKQSIRYKNAGLFFWFIKKTILFKNR